MTKYESGGIPAPLTNNYSSLENDYSQYVEKCSEPPISQQYIPRLCCL